MIKKIFNGAYKMFESRQEIRFQFQQENPSKLGEIINKYKIVFKTIDNCIGAGPHTSVYINSKVWKTFSKETYLRNLHKAAYFDSLIGQMNQDMY